jgi:cell division control protein 24
LQIFWKGDPGVENFKIKHANEEGLTHWKKILQRQREANTRSDTPGRGRASGQSTTTQFAWMANADPNDNNLQDSRDVSDDDDDDVTVIQDNQHNPHLSQLSGTTLASSRNGSTTSLRSRSATNESMPPPNPATFLPRGQQQQQAPPPATRYPLPSHTPPLTLNTNPIVQNLANSPERANGSYFSPVETPMATARAGSTSGQGYPFPRYPANNYHDDPNHYTPTSMSRTSSREGTPGNAQYAAFQNGAAYQNGQRLQRPSLPGMGSSNGISQQSRMRSASSPNIHHHLPNSSSLSKVSPGGNIPPVPSLPGTYIPYSGGPAVINRSQNNSPISPQLPIQGRPDTQDYGNGTSTPTSSGVLTPPPGAMSQVKIKIQYNGDKLAIVVPYSIPYAQLIDRIERKVRICGNGPEISPTAPIRIRYQDEDGDFISMNSDDDVMMAFDVACEGAVKDAQGTFGAVTLYVQVG